MSKHKRLNSDLSDIDGALLPPRANESATIVSPSSINHSSSLSRGFSKQTSSLSALSPSITASSANEDGSTSLLEGGFWYEGEKVRAKVGPSSISWKPVSNSILRCTALRKLNIRLPFTDVLSACTVPQDRCSCSGACRCVKEFKMAIYGVARKKRAPCEWKLIEHVLVGSTQEQVKEWVAQVNIAVSAVPDRPKSLLVFVNPYSGAKKGKQIWDSETLPIFEKARVKYTIIETTRQDHAKDVVAEMSTDELNLYHGIVAVGGDGVFQEIVRGLLIQRERGGEAAAAAQRIRVGHVPAGSTDAVAYTVHGTRSTICAALHIVLGDRLGLDLGRIDAADGAHNYFVCQAGYGFMGDVIKWSEKFRWLGPSRYELSGAVQFLRLRSYEARVSYKEVDEDDNPGQVVCTHGCSVCRAAKGKRPSSMLQGHCRAEKDVVVSNDRLAQPGWRTVEGRFISIMCVATTCRSDKSHNGIIPHGHLSDGRMNLVLVSSCNHIQYLTFLITLASRGLRPGQFPFVHVLPCTSVSVTPLGKESCWNVDGELLRNNTVTINAHQTIVDIFARGIETQHPAT